MISVKKKHKYIQKHILSKTRTLLELAFEVNCYAKYLYHIKEKINEKYTVIPIFCGA